MNYPNAPQSIICDDAHNIEANVEANIETSIETSIETQINTLIDPEANQASPHLSPASNQFKQQLKHFQLKQRLGSGGCGSVFLAHDNQLQRDVAIKILTSGRCSMNQALLTEARMQAEIEHPNICKIYQVAEAQTDNCNSYLVMQYIPGKSALQWLKDQKTVNPEQIITLMQKVCDGLQALHAHGIIHRDIKPANIMLADHCEDGIHPYMVDFGLANHNDDINRQNTITAGTPSFMSPEQLHGSSLDRTSDIYSFGATLYQLLTGLQPQSIALNAHPCKAFNSPQWQNLPVDVKAIICKCMQPLRQNRYPSAKEVNDDLLRYLAGEPVLSLPDKSYWLKKKLLKHKWPVVLVALLTVGGFTEQLWQQYQQHQQQVREQFITSFTSRVESLEAKVKLSKMAARHDISVETNQWQQEITTLNHEMNNIGERAYGPGHYAIGRMYYAMQQYESALENLQQAWDSGFVQTRVAYNLALSHGAIYQRQKAIILNISSTSTRKDRMAQLDKQHRQPAIEFLEQGMSGSPYQSYAKALLQYYQGENDKALATLANSHDLPSWFYQHHILRGDIYLAKMQSTATSQNNPQDAKQALAHYAQAAQQGRSDLQLQLKPLAVYFRILNNGLYDKQYGKQTGFNHTYQQAMTLVDNAITIAPAHYQPYFNKGQLLSLKSEYQDQYSGHTIATQQQAIEQLQLALSHASSNANSSTHTNNADILLSLGLAYSQKIKLLQDRAFPVGSIFESAIDTFAQIPKQNRDYSFYNSYASLLYTIAVHDGKQQPFGPLKKGPPLSLFQSQWQMNQKFADAINAWHQASQLQPQRIGAIVNAGSAYQRWAEFVVPVSAQQKLKQAITQYQQARRLNPEHFVVNYALAMSYSQLSEINNSLLLSNNAEIKQAQKFAALAEQAQPGHPMVISVMVALDVQKAIAHWQQGLPYQHLFDHNKKRLKQALTDNTNNAQLLDTRAWLYRKELQLSYFQAGKTELNIDQYQLALAKVKNIISSRNEDLVLLQLLNNHWKSIEPATITALLINKDTRLAKAEWYSQSGNYQQAERYFDGIKHYELSLLWLYRRQHLQRWAKASLSAAVILSTEKKGWLNAQIAQLDKQLQQHYPALSIAASQNVLSDIQTTVALNHNTSVPKD
ncbi:MAG: serine/threonine protein kinase [Phenylobacterium sp.]|jgi:serine/threonine protein kinase